MSREQLSSLQGSLTFTPRVRPRSGLNFTPALRLVVVGLLHCFASIPESPAEPACLLSMGIWGPLLGRGCRGADRTARRNPPPYILSLRYLLVRSPYVRPEVKGRAECQ